jgi:beta-galactosidase
MHSIDLTRKPPPLLSGHLKMGGRDPQGRAINANSHYLTLDGHPWLPVMGEIHYSRFPMEEWETALRKMKAGGIDIAATYIFWIHHEEVEGQFNWSGNLDLNQFIWLCAKVGLYCYPRIGPWAHGECRNGGFPDWLVEKCGSVARTDDPRYLSFAARLYREIFDQVRGTLWKEGGPVVGIQLENELLNNGTHIRTLKDLAVETGFDVPIYTMTGWGPAEIPPGDEVIPVFGGYPDAFWERQVQTWARDSRKHYFFNALRDDNTIGADLNKREGTFDLTFLERFPFGTCETGGGMQVSYHRRPVIAPDDIAALAMMKVGNGSNIQGYYMYHGGSHPLGQRSTMQESQATGYWNDVPIISYDFQAPLGEYGQVRESYHALRPLHLFLRDFGPQLAPLPTYLPERMPASLDDQETVRWAVRADGQRGFLFFNNYQRIEQLPEKNDVQFALHLEERTITIPHHPVKIPSGVYGFWPVNMDLGGALLQYATAQPICRLGAEGVDTFVFGALPGIQAEFVFELASLQTSEHPTESRVEDDLLIVSDLNPGLACLMNFKTVAGRSIRILLLESDQARQLYKLHLWGQDLLALSPNGLYEQDGDLFGYTQNAGPFEFALYPPPPQSLSAGGRTLTGQQYGLFTRYSVDLPEGVYGVEAERVQAAGPAAPVGLGSQGVATPPEEDAYQAGEIWKINLPPEAASGTQETFLRIAYTGDAARLYLGEQLLADNFYNGEVWEIGLKRFAGQNLERGLSLHLVPLRRDAPIYLSETAWPDFGEQAETVYLDSINLRTAHTVPVSHAP